MKNTREEIASQDERLVRRMIAKGHSRVDAEDLAQEAIMASILHVDAGNEIAKVWPFLCMVADRKAIDEYRRRKSQANAIQQVEAVRAAKEQTYALILDAVRQHGGRLRNKERDLRFARAYYLHSRSLAEIAKYEGVTRGAVKLAIQRLRKLIQK